MSLKFLSRLKRISWIIKKLKVFSLNNAYLAAQLYKAKWTRY